MGTHWKFNKKTRKRFIEYLAATGNVSYACRMVRVSTNCAYKAKSNLPNFSANWDDAVERAAEKLEDGRKRTAIGKVEGSDDEEIKRLIEDVKNLNDRVTALIQSRESRDRQN